MNQYFLKSFFLSTLLFLSCDRPVAKNSFEKIIGGRATFKDEQPTVVAILRNKAPICSGTLISKNLILTAGHCVEKFLNKSDTRLEELEIFFGEDANHIETGATSKVMRAGIHPLFWQDHLSALDFALLEIEQDFTITPSDLLLDRTIIGSMIDNNRPTVISGFGLTKNNPDSGNSLTPDFGVKNIAEPIIQGSKGDELFVGNSQIDACSGDSGGPVFVQANPKQLKLISVTSRGPFPCAREHNPGISTFAVAGVCWFQEFATIKNSEWEKSCQEEIKGFTPSQQLLNRIEGDETTLSLSGYNIQEISWLAKGKNLTKIKLPWNRIKDLTVLLDLQKLETLDVRGNEISDFSTIEKLKSRTVTVLGEKSQKSNLAETEFLRLSSQGIGAGIEIRSTILALRAVLANGTYLRKSLDLSTRIHLDLSNHEVRSLKPLKGLENLEVLIIAKNKNLTDLNVLTTLPRLRYLDISGVPKTQALLELVETLSSKGVTVVGFN